MRTLSQLAPCLIGAGAALFTGSALAAQMYLNPLAGDETVSAKTYGAVEANAGAGIEAYAGLTLPAPIAATSNSSRGDIPSTSPAIAGAFTEMLGNDGTNKYVATHTVAGWFKVVSLPTTSGSYTFLWIARNDVSSGDYAGYGVAVDPDGKLMIGRYKSSDNTLRDNLTSSTAERRLITTDGVMSGDTWTHIAVSLSSAADGNTYTTTVKVFVNGVEKALNTNTSFKSNLNGTQKCQVVQLGTGVSAAGFYVDDEAITAAGTIQAWAVDPTKNLYAAQWTRNVPGGGNWYPTGADFYPWSAPGMTLTSTNPLVYRGSVTLNVTATEASTLALNASPSLTVLTTAYSDDGTGTLTLAPSGSNTLTAQSTTISAKTVLSGTGFSLGDLSITSTGTLSVGENRNNFTLSSIAEGGKLIVTPTASELAAGRISLQIGELVTLSTTNVEVTGYDTFTATGGTITLPIPTWTPTTENTSWNANWSSTPSDGGSAILDLSNLTAAQTVTIPASVNWGSTSIIGASESVPVTIESGASLGALTVFNQATLPANLPASSVILQSGAILSLTGDGTIGSVISGAGKLRIASGTTTLSKANTYTGGTTIETGATVVLENANALGTAANITGGGTIKSASLPACNLTATGWTGTLRLTADIDDTWMDWSAYGNANSTFEIPTGVDISGYFSASAWTLRAKVILNGSITINNGSSTYSYTFTGPLSGSGTFSLTTANATIVVLLQDVTAFTGTLSTSTVKKTFIVGTGHTYNSSNDGGKIVIAGTLTSNAVRTWSATNGIVVEGTLTTSLSEEETTAGYTLSGVTVASGGKVRFVRQDGWVFEGSTNVYDPNTASYVAEWTGGGESDTNWDTVANWACNGQAVTTAPGTSLASLTVAAGKTITLPGAVTVGSLTTSGDFTLAGAADTSLTAQAVTLGGAVTLNAPLVLDLASALETNKAITVNASGALTTSGTVSLTSASCAFAGPLTVESGSLTWRHDSNDKTISGAVTVKEGATFATVSNYKHYLTLEGDLSGAGTVRVKVPTESNQHDGARFLNLQGACTDFTGTVELEMTVTGATSNGETMPRRTSVVIKPSDNVFNGSIDVVKVVNATGFADTDTAVAEGLWPYSKIFFAGNCTFTGTIGGQGTVYIGRTGNRDNTKMLEDDGASHDSSGNTFVGTVTLTNQLATYAGSVAIPDSGSTLLIQPTKAVPCVSKLSGSGAITVGGTGEVNVTAANGDYNGTITINSGATLTNKDHGEPIPFGKGRIVNNGTLKLIAGTKVADYGCALLPPTSGTGDIVFCSGSETRIPGEIATTGTITFEAASGDAVAAKVTFVTSGDFPDQAASISRANVVIGSGVTLANADTNGATSPMVTIAADKSLSGGGTIKVPVTFDETAKILIGTKDVYPTILGKITLPETNKIRVDLPSATRFLAAAHDSGLTFENFALVNETPALTDHHLSSTDPSLDQVIFSLVKKTALPSGVKTEEFDDAVTVALALWESYGIRVSEITQISPATSSGTKVEDGSRSIDAAALFTNVLSIVPDSTDFETTAKALVSYDFGVSDITVKSANLTGAAQLYVVVCAKVSNGETGDTAADYVKDTTTVSLWLNDKVCDGAEGNGPKATELSEAQLTALGIEVSKGEKWFAVPMEGLGVGTSAFTVRASNTTQAETTP
ncbi:MAG: beta strand repeat-containing protein [Candidatus Spyradenecus sp.]